jgi:preprotein translocase subunit SecA
MLGLIAKKIFGSVNERVIKELSSEISKINSFEDKISSLSDDELKNKTHEFKERLKNGSTLEDILPESFAVVREAAKRVLNMRHFDVQLIGGIALHRGKIAEMRTGEGKTLVATLPCYLNALSEKGVHVVTPNDYLSVRDSEWMGKIHRFLDLSVGCITNDLNDEERKEQYNCDITYATNNELGFDYLRDNMKFDKKHFVQRGHNFAIVDEVDSILIDEARTPLIISGPTNDNSKLYQEINYLIPKLTSADYQIEEKERNVFLTDAGIENLESTLKKIGLIKEQSTLFDPEYLNLIHHINQALKAHKIFKNEIDYIVKDNSIIIIDEFTGRMQEGRRFSDGLHQALEAKEGVRVRNENQTLASITFQNYFRLYPKLAGMTGTAQTEAVEFEEIYNLKVVEIPTNKIVKRIDEDDEIYKTEKNKYQAIINAIKEAHQKKQPILVGTISIEKSEYLSKLLKAEKLPHNVLNAKYHEQEAEIISQAGVPSAITIATNMAGRGTDIMLGGNAELLISKEKDSDKINQIKAKVEEDKKTAIEAGGLFVIATERHESRRIDNQLRGRSGRQGDPGRSKFFLSLDDDLMRIFGSEKLQSTLSKLGLKDDEAIFHPWITKTLEKAQQKVETRNYEIRKNLLKFDDVVNEQRKVIFKNRFEVISSNDISDKVKEIIKNIAFDLTSECVDKKSYHEEWKIDLLEKEILRIFAVKIDIKSESVKDSVGQDEIFQFVFDQLIKSFATKEEIYSSEILRNIEKQLYLITLDSEWKYHLLSLDKLRNSINLRAYAQKDPLMEYKKEAFELFSEMMMRIEENFITKLFQIKINTESEEDINLLPKNNKKFITIHENPDSFENVSNKKEIQPVIRTNFSADQRDPNNPETWGNVGRNEACPCGSGKKYKQCHGKLL